MTVIFFFFNDTATTEIYTLSLHDALPISELAMYGAVAGSLLQLLVQLPTVLALLGGVRAGLGWSTPELHGVVRSFAPIAFARGVTQVSAFVDTIIASKIALSAVASLGYAQLLATDRK